MREKNDEHNGIMLGRMIPFLPGNFLGTGSSGCAAQRGVAKDVPAARRRGAVVVAAATVADGAAMERLAAPVDKPDKPRSETGHSASSAGVGRDADEGRSAAGAVTPAALAARLFA
jgi:hypothetical protein